MKILLPKAVHLVPPTVPLFFLAGPVRGGGDWQAECCVELHKRLPEFYVALPCRYNEHHPLTKHQPIAHGTVGTFDRQLDWETHYLEQASRSGGIIFWLPCEDKENPREGHEPYAMETRRELGEWMGRLIHEKSARVTVGAEAGFPGLSQIERNFRRVAGNGFTIHASLQQTVAAAVAFIT